MKPSQIALLTVAGVLAAVVVTCVVSVLIAISHADSESVDAKAIAAGAERFAPVSHTRSSTNAKPGVGNKRP